MEKTRNDELSTKQIAVMNMRYTMIVGLIPLVDNKKALCTAVNRTADQYGVSRATVKNYLKTYLESGEKISLAPKQRKKRETLTAFEKDIRWALNKYYYTADKRSLTDTYTLMIKERYYKNGELLEHYPTFYQFRYYYEKTKSISNSTIRREGLAKYQRDKRPLLGEGVQAYCTTAGCYMLDSTICDIYLVNDAGQLVGRPILTAAVDGYTGLCCGYSLGWEGGNYSLRKLMKNIITDKVEHCKKFGISIKKEDWNCHNLAGKFITDRGSEYASENFSQITELGITVENLPPFRPELKGSVEQFFCCIQNYFKPHLKGKGLIEPDYNERGSVDYRKQACLTLKQFETILLYCIIYYNSQRVINNFPFTQEMLADKVKPYASDIWNWTINNQAVDLIDIDAETLRLVLLPRTSGKFTRRGLVVNKLRYKAEGFNEAYLEGKSVVVAYNPDSMNRVWLIENGEFVPFDLIDGRFKTLADEDVRQVLGTTKVICKAEKESQLLAKVKLAEAIQVVAQGAVSSESINIKNIRKVRSAETLKARIGANNE